MIVAALHYQRSRVAADLSPACHRAVISLITLTLGNAEIWQGFYQSASLADVMWILPFSFYPWAASRRAAFGADARSSLPRMQTTPSRPWVIFGGLALLPLIDYGLRRASPAGPLDTFQDLSTAVAIVSVLPLLMARLAVERAELRAGGRASCA